MSSSKGKSQAWKAIGRTTPWLRCGATRWVAVFKFQFKRGRVVLWEKLSGPFHSKWKRLPTLMKLLLQQHRRSSLQRQPLFARLPVLCCGFQEQLGAVASCFCHSFGATFCPCVPTKTTKQCESNALWTPGFHPSIPFSHCSLCALGHGWARAHLSCLGQEN